MLASKYKCTEHSYLYLLSDNPQTGMLIPQIRKVLSYKQAIMTKTSSPYRWLGYMFVWMVACLFILNQEIRSDIFIIILLLLAIVINSYCAYKFALEKGAFLAILAFVVAMIFDFFPYFLYFIVMGVILEY